MDVSFAELVQRYGYLAVLGGTLLEGETVLLLAGVAAHQGHLDFALVCTVAFAGGTLGDQFFFWFGRVSGPRLLQRWPRLGAASSRIGPLLLRHDALLIFSIRFMYGLRIAGPIVIGALGVKVGRFSVFNVLGAAVWAPLIAGAGYVSGHALDPLLGDFAVLGIVGACFVLVALGHRWWSGRAQHPSRWRKP